MKRLSKYILLIILISCLACTGSQSKYMGLLDQGILPLSTDNAFLGANIFLSQELELDPNLEAFFRSHGSPDAIEIKSKNIFQEQFVLFYLRDGSKFVGTDVADKAEKRKWIFRGPYRIPWNEGKKLQPLVNGNKIPALLFVHGQHERYYKTGEAPKQDIIQIVVPTPKPTPVIKPRPRRSQVRKPTNQQTAGQVSLNPMEFYKMNADQRALLMSKGYAARAENGDIIHIVKQDGETLSSIAKWYTGSEEQAQEIASQNGLGTETELKRGNQIRVPLKAITNDKMMPKNYK